MLFVEYSEETNWRIDQRTRKSQKLVGQVLSCSDNRWQNPGGNFQLHGQRCEYCAHDVRWVSRRRWRRADSWKCYDTRETHQINWSRHGQANTVQQWNHIIINLRFVRFDCGKNKVKVVQQISFIVSRYSYSRLKILILRFRPGRNLSAFSAWTGHTFFFCRSVSPIEPGNWQLSWMCLKDEEFPSECIFQK